MISRQNAREPTAVPGADQPDPGPRRRRRGPVIALVAAAAIAIAWVAILISSSTSQPTQSSGGADPAPGIDLQSADLLGLDVLPGEARWAAPNFHLVDQHGQPASMSALRGKVVIWSLNDDKCTDLCRLFAQDVVAADRDLGAARKDVVFLSVNANPFYPSPAALRAWSNQNDLETLSNWVYTTGTPAQLESTWSAYHETVELDRKTRTVEHSTAIDFVDQQGQVRAMGDFSSGAGYNGSVSTAYYGHAMAQMAMDLLPAKDQVNVGGPDVDSLSTQGATIGDRAPGFTLPEMGGQGDRSIASFEHKPLVLNFWSSTCSACLHEMPALEKTDKAFAGHVNFVGVDVSDPRSAGAAFARRLGVTYPLLDDHDGTTAADYRVPTLPVTFVIDPGGKITARHFGQLTYAEIVAVLDMDFPKIPPV